MVNQRFHHYKSTQVNINDKTYVGKQAKATYNPNATTVAGTSAGTSLNSQQTGHCKPIKRL
jgi:hypothetical protein